MIVFNSLEKEHIFEIIEIELAKLFKRIKEIGYDLVLSDAARDYIAEKGFDKQYGARPLKRAIQKYIEDALAQEIVNANLEEGRQHLHGFGRRKTRTHGPYRKGRKVQAGITFCLIFSIIEKGGFGLLFLCPYPQGSGQKLTIVIHAINVPLI